MKINELVALLQAQPQDADVHIIINNGDNDETSKLDFNVTMLCDDSVGIITSPGVKVLEGPLPKKEERVTIVTLYREGLCEHYVGAFRGTASRKEKEQIAAEFDAPLDDASRHQTGDLIGFREVTLCTGSPSELAKLENIWLRPGEEP
jgi:hypothetical protein